MNSDADAEVDCFGEERAEPENKTFMFWSYLFLDYWVCLILTCTFACFEFLVSRIVNRTTIELERSLWTLHFESSRPGSWKYLDWGTHMNLNILSKLSLSSSCSCKSDFYCMSVHPRKKDPSTLVLSEVYHFPCFSLSFPSLVHGSKGRGCHICIICQSPVR